MWWNCASQCVFRRCQCSSHDPSVGARLRTTNENKSHQTITAIPCCEHFVYVVFRSPLRSTRRSQFVPLLEEIIYGFLKVDDAARVFCVVATGMLLQSTPPYQLEVLYGRYRFQRTLCWLDTRRQADRQRKPYQFRVPKRDLRKVVPPHHSALTSSEKV